MKNTLKSFLSLGKGELCLWGGSVLLVLLSFFLFDRTGYLTLISSLVGVTSLIFNAKGNPVGPILMVLFSIFYGVISFSFSVSYALALSSCSLFMVFLRDGCVHYSIEGSRRKQGFLPAA